MAQENYGYAGSVLYIDLSREKAERRRLSYNDVDKFIGGIGLAVKIVVDEIPDPRIDPFSPDNVLVFMTGALTGSPVYGAARYVVASKSPLTMAWGESHISGYWGPELKRAGFDGIVIRGRASTSVYLFIRDGTVEFRDASKLWGLDVFETDEVIKKELGDSSVKVATIGPAGENLARIACIASDIQPNGPRIGGRTGMGAVMGSKNLKAIAVKGSGRIGVKDASRVSSVLSRLLPLIMSSPTAQILASFGTAGEVEEFYEYGDMPIKNFTLGEFSGYRNITGPSFKERGIVVDVYGCWACPVKCWKVVKVDGRMVRAPEYETIASLGTLLMIDDPNYLARVNYLCYKYGIDTISTGVTIAWAIECFERGLITTSDTGGLELRWGDKEVVTKLIEILGRRIGFGSLLAEGCRQASRIIGKGTGEFCMHVKGTEMPMHDPRAFKGMGLQYVTSNRGADHLYGLFFRIEQGQRVHDLKIYERVDRFECKGKGWMVATMEIWSEVLECMGICKFVDIPPAHIAGLYTYVTGIRKMVPDLLKIGKRVFTLKRLFNIANGITRADDTLPKRFLMETLREGGSRNQVVELEPMLREYYEFMGWNENGIPRRETLEELGLSEYAVRFSIQ
ncbi:MAG: aldehyde ferredoxin oxidoreductase family protein [Ignisphaera sp.]|nr:aldehyde ferredoxin oxidoreductase family protein [Ignisphaera sp.]MCX8167548.1 aldehyde ferredoxin oxidoreductase family protein [Ignisphaera sp.]MDW8086211.1 aldehyde ferredoxin oxidoreductase family protein [Ignisphaera sp.]